MRIMAIDLGDVRTGVSVSDISCTLAGKSITVAVKSRIALIEAIGEIYRQEDVGQIVVGLPVNMDGSHGAAAQKSKDFGTLLSQMLEAEVVYWDERGSSVMANRILSDAGKKRSRQRAQVDAVAAAVILQNYLDYRNQKAPKAPL